MTARINTAIIESLATIGLGHQAGFAWEPWTLDAVHAAHAVDPRGVRLPAPPEGATHDCLMATTALSLLAVLAHASTTFALWPVDGLRREAMAALVTATAGKPLLARMPHLAPHLQNLRVTLAVTREAITEEERLLRCLFLTALDAALAQPTDQLWQSEEGAEQQLQDWLRPELAAVNGTEDLVAIVNRLIPESQPAAFDEQGSASDQDSPADADPANADANPNGDAQGSGSGQAAETPPDSSQKQSPSADSASQPGGHSGDSAADTPSAGAGEQSSDRAQQPGQENGHAGDQQADATDADAGQSAGQGGGGTGADQDSTAINASEDLDSAGDEGAETPADTQATPSGDGRGEPDADSSATVAADDGEDSGAQPENGLVLAELAQEETPEPDQDSIDLIEGLQTIGGIGGADREAFQGAALSQQSALEARITSALLQVLQSETTKRSKAATAGARIDPRKLWRVKAVGDLRVFRSSQQRIGRETAVQVLLDTSGSMNQSMDFARKVALATTRALSRMSGIKVAASIFPGFRGDHCSTLLPFNGSIIQAQRLFAGIEAGGGTPLAEALMSIRPALLDQQVHRRVVMVITDGQPGNVALALRAIADLEDAGVEICGIGIGIDIRKVLPWSVHITDVNELPKAITQLFREIVQLKAA